MKFSARPFNVFFANSIDAYIPELWANESLLILEDNIVAAGLVYRDFENLAANFGDTVNTRLPASFVATRKDVNDDITIQNATATNVAVPLDQHVHVSFLIRDVEQAKSFKNLVTEYLEPAMIAQAKFVDQVVIGQYPQFLANQVGALSGISSTTAKDYMLYARNKFNTNKAPEGGRNMLWTPNSETAALQQQLFLDASQVGDQGQAMREAALGRKLGLTNYMSQLTGSVPVTATDVVTGAINAGNTAVGTTTITVDGLSAAITAGTWFKVSGFAYQVVSTTGGATPTAITIASPGLIGATANDAVVTISAPGAVNLVAGYDAGYVGAIAVNDFTNMPVPGQFVTFGATTTKYTIVQSTSTTITLDRPLVAALANDDTVNPGPSGEYNFGFVRNAIALVVRPLAVPPAMVRSAVVNNRGLAMRATVSYDYNKQGTAITLDMLMGVKVLDVNLGVVMVG